MPSAAVVSPYMMSYLPAAQPSPRRSAGVSPPASRQDVATGKEQARAPAMEPDRLEDASCMRQSLQQHLVRFVAHSFELRRPTFISHCEERNQARQQRF